MYKIVTIADKTVLYKLKFAETVSLNVLSKNNKVGKQK